MQGRENRTQQTPAEEYETGPDKIKDRLTAQRKYPTKIIDRIKLIGFIVFIVACILGGLYYSFKSNKIEKQQKALFIRECFNQNYNYTSDNLEDIIFQCKQLYNKSYKI